MDTQPHSKSIADHSLNRQLVQLIDAGEGGSGPAWMILGEAVERISAQVNSWDLEVGSAARERTHIAAVSNPHLGPDLHVEVHEDTRHIH